MFQTLSFRVPRAACCPCGRVARVDKPPVAPNTGIANERLGIGEAWIFCLPIAACCLPTAYCLLPTAYCFLVERHLQSE
jgi:hypothetical protein